MFSHASKDEDVEENRSKPLPSAARCCSNLGRMPVVKGTKKGPRYEGGVGSFNSRLWEVGLKLVADGSPHCGTAATREPYMKMPISENLGFPPAPGYGIMNMDTEALYDTVKRHHLQGTQLAIHCHGERSSEQVLRIYEQVTNM